MLPQINSRSTKAKQLIEEIFKTTPKPISIREVFRYVKISLPNVAYSTIFRITLRLEREGLIKRVDWRERGSHYEWASMPHHHHILCQICKKIVDIDDEELNYAEQRIQEKTGYLIKHHSIELEGICPECQHFD